MDLSPYTGAHIPIFPSISWQLEVIPISGSISLRWYASLRSIKTISSKFYHGRSRRRRWCARRADDRIRAKIVPVDSSAKLISGERSWVILVAYDELVPQTRLYILNYVSHVYLENRSDLWVYLVYLTDKKWHWRDKVDCMLIIRSEIWKIDRTKIGKKMQVFVD